MRENEKNTELLRHIFLLFGVSGVLSVKSLHYSWVKNTFLVLGLLLGAAAISFRNSVSDMGEINIGLGP